MRRSLSSGSQKRNMPRSCLASSARASSCCIASLASAPRFIQAIDFGALGFGVVAAGLFGGAARRLQRRAVLGAVVFANLSAM